jgi:hypothetical protein
METMFGNPVAVLSRVVHILSVIMLLGGLMYAWNLSDRGKPPQDVAAGFRPSILVSILLILASGLYNFLTKAAYPPGYHALFGIKFLLFLHIAAVSLVIVKPATTVEKRTRLLKGVVMSGVAVVTISGLLRALTLQLPR